MHQKMMNGIFDLAISSKLIVWIYILEKKRLNKGRAAVDI